MNTPHLRVVILGSGAADGVPMPCCDCKVCSSTDPRNQRLRSSIFIQVGGHNILVDVGPDFRTQVLRNQIKKIDTVLLTHTHADHCHGCDDLRNYFYSGRKTLPMWLDPSHEKPFLDRFGYMVEKGGYFPQPVLDIHKFTGPFHIGELLVEPMNLPHGSMVSTAFKIGSFVYATDFANFPTEAIDAWRGKVDTMIASAIRHRAHPTHSTIAQTIEIFKTLKVRRGIISHISHEIEHGSEASQLPAGVELGYDGKVVEMFVP